jgi:hypothetical protein
MTHDPDSIESVAYALFERIAYVEGKDVGLEEPGLVKPDRRWILSTYGECLRTVRSAKSAATGEAEAHEGYAGFREVPREAILASTPI